MKKPTPELLAMSEAHNTGDINAARALLQAHPELERTAPLRGGTWLHCAAESGSIALVELWLERGWDVNLNSPGGPADDGLFTALHMAKDAAMTRYLLSRGAFVNACHRELGTPLHYAVSKAFEPSQMGRRREG